MNLWKDIKTPITCLAPMEGVTDSVFRRVIDECGRPDVRFTEFTSVDGLFSKGMKYVAKRLEFEAVEKPLVAQIWGLKPSNFEKAVNMLVEMGFDGVDINMGCPAKDVTKKGAGGAMVENRDLAKELIRATKRGAAGRVPVSVKIRIGMNKVVTEDWVEDVLAEGIDALTVHGRTVKQQSKVEADWGEIGKAVKVRDGMGVETRIIGNGDVMSLAQVDEKVKKHGVDGVMVGRGIFHDPWLFNPDESFADKTVKQKLDLLLRHVDLYETYWGDSKPFHVLRKYFKIYVNDFVGAKKLRTELMEAENGKEVNEMVAQGSRKYGV